MGLPAMLLVLLYLYCLSFRSCKMDMVLLEREKVVLKHW